MIKKTAPRNRVGECTFSARFLPNFYRYVSMLDGSIWMRIGRRKRIIRESNLRTGGGSSEVIKEGLPEDTSSWGNSSSFFVEESGYDSESTVKAVQEIIQDYKDGKVDTETGSKDACIIFP